VKVDPLDRLEAVGEEAWDRLLARSAFPSPFMSWAWQRAWLTAFAAERRLHLLRVVSPAGELVGILPLYDEGPALARLVGGTEVSDYLDLIAPAGLEEEVWAALLESRAAAPETWDLHAVRAGSATARLLPGLAPVYGLRAVATVEERCPVLDLPATWEAYLGQLTSRHRHELQRKVRRLERELPGAAVRASHSRAELEVGLAGFFALHRRSRAGKARFMDAQMEAFFRSAVGALAVRDQARLWTLEHDDRAIAAFLCLEWPGAVGLYNSGFDVSRAALSPGIVLLGHVIRDAIERGVGRFDFLRGEESYKLGFGARPADLYRVEVGR
jgi:CelD/BcsL family acetyltransferase involved in cellulose biosynthesis